MIVDKLAAKEGLAVGDQGEYLVAWWLIRANGIDLHVASRIALSAGHCGEHCGSVGEELTSFCRLGLIDSKAKLRSASRRDPLNRI
ncbi:hypothetical protein Poly24_27970 [Rosistilla carotiformis]|uniref:Uncharacterized protein n=1 Tax=Rosistilla carotiformis TaxID=2528017 RepID=A0A518JU62_9BACT|nr:hypothetical protein Poly24_27970 [Rosistilla carotiformis]